MLIVENTPTIVLFWFLFIAIFVFMIALIITAILLIKKNKKQGDNKLLLLGKMCAGFGIVCAIPIILVVGYMIYLQIR